MILSFVVIHTECKIRSWKNNSSNPRTANGWFFGDCATAVVFDTKTRDSEFIKL